MRIIREIVSWSLHLLGAVVFAMIITIFLVQPMQVEGSSMEPTLHDKERLVINKTVNILKCEPNYGDIIIIDSRIDRTRTLLDNVWDAVNSNLFTQLLAKKREGNYWIKRVIGKSGDELQFGDEVIVRNGTVIEETYLKEIPVYSVGKKVVVPEGYIFVMGDNRNNSRDSREIGCIPLSHVIGKLLLDF